MTELTPRRRNRVYKALHKPLTYLGVMSAGVKIGHSAPRERGAAAA
jgi:hypothetical protein